MKTLDKSGTIGAIAIIGIILLAVLLVGSVWGFVAVRQQADKIDALNLQLADSVKAQNAANSDAVAAELVNANKQIQLYKEFLVVTADVKEEVKVIKQYDIDTGNSTSYSYMYQLCADSADRSNDVNLAMSRFAEKEITYYQQIVVLADKPQCAAKIDALTAAMVSSKAADEKRYNENIAQCRRLMNYPIENSTMKNTAEWENAVEDAVAKAKAFTAAEKAVIACFA